MKKHLSWSNPRPPPPPASSRINPLSPNINMHLLHTVLHTFLMVLLERICSNITTFHLWWSFHSLSWPVCLIRQCYCWEKLHVDHYLWWSLTLWHVWQSRWGHIPAGPGALLALSDDSRGIWETALHHRQAEQHLQVVLQQPRANNMATFMRGA